eukprot:6790187-Prymnesium_polylepis.1
MCGWPAARRVGRRRARVKALALAAYSTNLASWTPSIGALRLETHLQNGTQNNMGPGPGAGGPWGVRRT